MFLRPVMGDRPQVGAPGKIGAVDDAEGKQAQFVPQAIPHLHQGVGRDVNAGPLAAQLFGGDAGGGAAAEGIQYQIAGIAGGVDNPFQQGQRLLRGIVSVFLGVELHRGNVGKDVLHRRAFGGFQIAFQGRLATPFRPVNQAGGVQGLQAGVDAGIGVRPARNQLPFNDKVVHPAFGRRNPMPPDQRRVNAAPGLAGFSGSDS